LAEKTATKHTYITFDRELVLVEKIGKISDEDDEKGNEVTSHTCGAANVQSPSGDQREEK